MDWLRNWKKRLLLSVMAGMRRHEKCRGLRYCGVVGNPVSTVLL